MNEQNQLKTLIDKSIEQYGEGKAIEIIKTRGIGRFKTRQHYPHGVFIFCNSPEHGVMVGKR